MCVRAGFDKRFGTCAWPGSTTAQSVGMFGSGISWEVGLSVASAIG